MRFHGISGNTCRCKIKAALLGYYHQRVFFTKHDDQPTSGRKLTMSLSNRYDFVLVFDVRDGNLTSDPDAGKSAAFGCRIRAWSGNRCISQA